MCAPEDDRMGKLTLTVEEVAALWSISRASAYRGVRSGEIPSFRVGRRYVISRAVINRIMDATSQDARPGPAPA